jgi:hypothetical protein
MSCGCSNTTPITTTTNCGSCGYNCTNCTCPTNPIIEPVVVCADPEPCSELFPLECVIYTGEDIACTGTANTLYPNVLHYIVLENSNTIGRNFVSILNNINTQLCYLFSKDYISQFLTNIQNDVELSALFCSIVSACDCDCTLTCGTVNTAVYNSSTSPDTIDVNFTQVTGGSTITFQGTISGTTLTVTTPPASGAIAIGQKITGTGINLNTFITAGSALSWTLSVSSTVASAVTITATHITYIVSIYNYSNGNYYYLNDNTNDNTSILFPSNITATTSVIVTGAGYDNTTPWLVSVFANDELAATECTSGYYVPYEETPVPIENYDGCGFGFIEEVPALECPTICIPFCEARLADYPRCNNYWGIDNTNQFATFTFTHTQAANTYPVSSYTIHWYKKIASGTPISNTQYQMQQTSVPVTITVSGNNQIISATTDIPYSSVLGWVLLITPNFDDLEAKQCNTSEYFSVRSASYEMPGAIYLYGEITSRRCNWFIYDDIHG